MVGHSVWGGEGAGSSPATSITILKEDIIMYVRCYSCGRLFSEFESVYEEMLQTCPYCGSSALIEDDLDDCDDDYLDDYEDFDDDYDFESYDDY